MEQKNDVSRRNFLKNASLAGAVTLGIPGFVSNAFAAKNSKKKISLQSNDVILFQGDSITDAGRKKTEPAFNNASALGTGYAMIAASEMLYKHPAKNFHIYNRGISGNKVFQLAERWDAEALDLKPNVISILVGVNDFWHTLVNAYKGTVKTYKDDYIALLDRTKQKFPEVKLIIGEPFALSGIKSVDEKWYPVFNDYRAAAREVAEKFNAVFIPYQSIFDNASKSIPGVYWTYDGVHPSLAGAHLMAHAWLKAVKA